MCLLLGRTDKVYLFFTLSDHLLKIEGRKKKLFVDWSAEKLLAAEKGERKIAVEIKSFVGKSDINDLEDAVGQYVLYETLLEEINCKTQKVSHWFDQ